MEDEMATCNCVSVECARDGCILKVKKETVMKWTAPFKIKYRFLDDPEDTVREYESKMEWDEEEKAFIIMPGFPGKSIVLL